MTKAVHIEYNSIFFVSYKQKSNKQKCAICFGREFRYGTININRYRIKGGVGEMTTMRAIYRLLTVFIIVQKE